MGLRKFPDIRKFAWKSTKTQRWNTEVRRSGSGQVRTMTTWTYPQWEITAQFVHLTIDEYKKIMGFFALLKGGTEPFCGLILKIMRRKMYLLCVNRMDIFMLLADGVIMWSRWSI